MKILIEYASGAQELRNVPNGARFQTSATVVWNEDEDGPFPAEHEGNVGGIVRNGKDLAFDPAKKSAVDSAKASSALNEDAKRQALRDSLDRIEAFDEDTATAAQRKQFFKDVQRALKFLARNK